MANKLKIVWNELLLNAQRRTVDGRRRVQEAFTTDHRQPVIVRLADLVPNTFYWFDDASASALFDTLLDWTAKQIGARLTLTCTAAGELQAQRRRLEHIASKLDQIRIFALTRPGNELLRGARIEYSDVAGTPLAQYRIMLVEARTPRLFIVRQQRPGSARHLGFFTSDPDIINEVADDMDALARGMSRRLKTFERLQLLHETTQQVARGLESYSRRMELAVERARRRPDLLTPERFERIVTQAIVKMEELKEIPRRALRSMDKRTR